MPPSILVCLLLRSTSSFLTPEPLFLLATYPDTRNQSRREAGNAFSKLNSGQLRQPAIFPHKTIRESILKRLYCLRNTLYVHKETIYYHRFRRTLYVKWLEGVRGWGWGGGVKTRELPRLNAKHVNIDSVTCFVDIT